MAHSGRLILLLLLSILLISGCQPILPAPAAPPASEVASTEAPATDAAATEAPAEPAAAPTPAPVASPPALSRAEVKFDTVESQALAGNLLGDPSARVVEVVLPPGYAEGDTRYPVLYVLPGAEGQPSDIAGGFMKALERLLRNQEIPALIVVGPDASMSLAHSQFRSSVTIGDHTGFLTRDLVEYIDGTYRTIPTRESRALAGCSMGGYATMRIGLEYPDVYSVLAPAGGWYEDTPWPSDYEFVETVTALPTTPADVRAHAYDPLGWYIQAAAGVTPNPDNPPLYLDMPLRMVDGKAEFVPEVIERIVSQDSVHLLARYLEQPIRLNGILIQHGTSDEIVPVSFAREFAELLTAQGVEFTFIEKDVGHCSGDWEAEALKFMAEKLEFEE